MNIKRSQIELGEIYEGERRGRRLEKVERIKEERFACRRRSAEKRSGVEHSAWRDGVLKLRK